jgi:TM2 domain-containing membrane protein YozV
MATKKCPYCGVDIDEDASRCYSCKEWLVEIIGPKDEDLFRQDVQQDFLPTALVAWFLGCFGIHRFYTGSIPIGLIQLFTAGGCGIWAYIDFIMICFGKYKDGQGRPLLNYNKSLGITLFAISLIPLVIVLFVLLIVAILLASVATKGS